MHKTASVDESEAYGLCGFATIWAILLPLGNFFRGLNPFPSPRTHILGCAYVLKTMSTPPTKDELLNERIAKLGKYSYQGGEYPELRWEKPITVPTAFQLFELIFSIEIQNADATAFALVLDEFDRLTGIADTLILDANRCAVELFREIYVDQMVEDELVPYRDGDSNISDELILAVVEPSAIVLTVTDEGISTELCFHSAWDDEHGLEFSVVGESMARPWKDGFN